jgi:Phosphotransferase enzyme family
VAPADVPPAVRAAVERRVADELGHTVRAWARLAGGTQNRLYRLDTGAGPPLLAKLYAVDRWPRLESEYAALRALNRQQLARVPRALLRDDRRSYAVYSFEPGAMRPAPGLSRRDVEQIAAFAADLHRFGPQHLPIELAPAVDASLRGRAAARHRAPPGGDRELGPGGRVAWRARHSPGSAPRPGARDGAPLPRAAWRLTTGDFGPQNFLFTDEDALTVVDWEAAGWDDPAHATLGFVAHAACEDLAPELAEAFLETYAALAGLPAAERARYERVGRWLDLAWVAVYASALSPENIANKAAAVRGFARQAYVAEVVGRLERRLARAAEGRGYRFPR